MPIRSPDDPVLRDSQATVWTAIREGLYDSNEVTQSGHWHPSRAATPWQSIRAQTPFGRQQPPTLSIVPPSPSEPPTPSPAARTPLAAIQGVQLNVMRVELAKDDRKRAAEDAALRKIHEGVRELDIARKM
jgi:hypothetical protein